jgi:hypothetical protein
MKSGNPNFLEPSGPLQARNGTALPLPTILLVCCYSVRSAFRHTYHGSIPLYERSVTTQHNNSAKIPKFINVSFHIAVTPAATYCRKYRYSGALFSGGFRSFIITHINKLFRSFVTRFDESRRHHVAGRSASCTSLHYAYHSQRRQAMSFVKPCWWLSCWMQRDAPYFIVQQLSSLIKK